MFFVKKYGALLLMVSFMAVISLWLTGGVDEYIITENSLYTGGDVYQPEANITRTLIRHDSTSPHKTAYLTFDDGPSENTGIILDALNQYGAKATFFVLGEKAEQNPDMVRRIFNEGHSIGNHSYNHDYDEVYGTREEFINELVMWERVVGDIIGSENLKKLFRFPGGSKEDWKYIYRNIASEMGYKFVDWTALNGDADGKPFSEQRCMDEIAKYCTDEGDVVILMHDSAKKDITARMMPQILEYLKGQGYNLKRIEV